MDGEDRKVINTFTGGHRFLSNFYLCWQPVDGLWYRTNEHYYQSQKALRWGDAERIRRAASPSEAKRIGRSVALREDWDGVKIDVMLKGLRSKFFNFTLRKMLLSTGDALLVEGNWWNDTYWGVDLHSGEGLNMLGKLLMRVREEVREETRILQDVQ